jgi:hypothetical protein
MTRSKPEKLLKRMRRSAAGWKPADLAKLYEGFGFEIRHGSRHDVIIHSRYPQLRTTLPRHKPIAKAYIAEAVKLVDKLRELEQQEEASANE